MNDEYVNFKKFCEVVVQIPPSIVRLMVDRAVKTEDLPFIRGVRLQTFGNPDPLTWRIHIESTKLVLSRIEKLSDAERRIIDQKIALEISTEKVKEVERKTLLAYNGRNISVFAWFDRIGYQQFGQFIQPTAESIPTSLLFKHVYEYDTGRKLADHVWCPIRWESNQHMHLNPGNYVKAYVQASRYQKTEELSPEEYLDRFEDLDNPLNIHTTVVKGGIKNIRAIETLTMTQARAWKAGILCKRKSQ